MSNLPRLIITPGEPAGIGPDIVLQLAQEKIPAELIVVADPNLLKQRAALLGLSIQLEIITEENLTAARISHPGVLKVLPVTLATEAVPGVLNPLNSAYVLECLTLASKLCLEKRADAMVTGPVHKEIMNAANIAFTGHTEFLAEVCGVKQTVMLFVVDQLKVALATTHLPLVKVSAALTQELLLSRMRILHAALINQFGIAEPRILVCGLNPHAGEGGYLGREEIDTITPALTLLRDEGMHAIGPLPADTIFTPKQLEKADAVLAMYHDQALPLVKYIGFGHAVNMTLGLPFVRTSVDHGTALDVAGTGGADPGSLRAAIEVAIGVL